MQLVYCFVIIVILSLDFRKPWSNPYYSLPQHLLCFSPLPQGHRLFLGTNGLILTFSLITSSNLNSSLACMTKPNLLGILPIYIPVVMGEVQLDPSVTSEYYTNIIMA